MSIEEKLAAHKKLLLSEIESAVRAKDAKAIISLSSKLEEIEALHGSIEQVKVALASLSADKRRGLSNILDNSVSYPMPDVPPKNMNQPAKEKTDSRREAQMRAEAARKAFLSKLYNRGIALTPKAGKRIFKNEKGNLVGIDYASERQADRWFYGPPLVDYSVLVLLCEHGAGPIEALILPKKFLEAISDDIMQVSRNRYKMNISKKRGEFYIKPPNKDHINITQFLNRFDYLVTI